MRRLVITAILALLTFAPAFGQRQAFFVFVQVNDKVLPIERGSKYEDPLDEALRKAKLGEVTGGGTQLARDGSVEWVGLDVELTDLSRGIPFLQRKLRELGAPRGTVIQYELNGRKTQLSVHDE
jgi:hypothetical protein